MQRRTLPVPDDRDDKAATCCVRRCRRATLADGKGGCRPPRYKASLSRGHLSAEALAAAATWKKYPARSSKNEHHRTGGHNKRRFSMAYIYALNVSRDAEQVRAGAGSRARTAVDRHRDGGLGCRVDLCRLRAHDVRAGQEAQAVPQPQHARLLRLPQHVLHHLHHNPTHHPGVTWHRRGCRMWAQPEAARDRIPAKRQTCSMHLRNSFHGLIKKTKRLSISLFGAPEAAATAACPVLSVAETAGGTQVVRQR